MTITADRVVLDIEGTLVATGHVHVGLYDYARPRLGPWIDEHGSRSVVADAVTRVRSLASLTPDASTDDVVAVLHDWMARDRKVTALKTLQGLIWQHGYATGALVTECFADVAPTLRRWHATGLRMAVFSSGSVAAQVALFAHTTDGDLTGLFDAHFDSAAAGPKRDVLAYRKITAELGADPARTVFASDVPAELDAASTAGLRTVGVARPGEPYGGADFGPHWTVASLDVIPL